MFLLLLNRTMLVEESTILLWRKARKFQMLSMVCFFVNDTSVVLLFVTNLIVLESKGIDVIVSMDWLSKYKVLIDCTKKSIKLNTSDGKEMEFVVESVVTSKVVPNRT
jgi:hypothetical protein